jgi:hypothetical protein
MTVLLNGQEQDVVAIDQVTADANKVVVKSGTISLPSGAAQDGTDITAPTAMPAGGVGIRGWLSAIWTKLNGTLGVSGTFYQTTQPVSVASAQIVAGAEADGHSATLGLTTTDAAATGMVEDTTAKTGIGLFKGIKNLLKLINDKLVSGTDIGDVTINNAVGAGVYVQPGTSAEFAVNVASGKIASGAVASGAIASGAIASGAVASGAIVDGADVTQGAKADGVVDAVMDTTGLTLVSILKSIHNRLYTLVHTGVTADTELPAAAALNGTILKSVSTPVMGAALLVSDNTNFIQPLGDAANGLDVDVTRMAALIAGEAHIGEVGGRAVPIIVTPTLTVGATYATGDFVGTNNTAIEFPGAARVVANSGSIVGATLIDYALASVVAELWLFSAAPAGLGLDSAAFTISDADALLCIGVIPFATYYASALNSISNGTIPNGNLPFRCPAGATSIFGALVTRGAPAYTNGLISVRICVSQD